MKGLVSGASTDQPWVAITFDTCNGGIGANTDQILKTFMANRMTGTLDVVGQQVAADPVHARNILAYGCEIGNHGWSHANLTTEADDGFEELRKCQRAVERATGFRTCISRPPGGKVNADVIAVATRLGMTLVKWGPSPSIFDEYPDHIAEVALEGIEPGRIVLLHANDQDIAALPAILRGLRARGLRSVRVTTLLGGRFTRRRQARPEPVLGAASVPWTEPDNVWDEV